MPPSARRAPIAFVAAILGCGSDPSPARSADVADVGALPDVMLGLDVPGARDVATIGDAAPEDLPDRTPDVFDAAIPEDLVAPPDDVSDVPGALDATTPDATTQDMPAPPDVPAPDAHADVPTLDARADVPTRDARADVPTLDARADVPPPDAPPGAWRSALFPDDWIPVHAGGRADASGRFLHDFSFAGYHRGDTRPPYGRGTVVRAVDPALGDARTDATPALQSAIDAACAAPVPAGGPRVVSLPAGTFRLRFPTPSPGTDPALRVHCSNLVVRGAGPAATRLFLDDPTNARTRAMIRFASRSLNVWSGAALADLARDEPSPTRVLTLATTPAFAPGDEVSVRTDVTEAFRADHRMNTTMMGVPLWPASTSIGLLYPRRVVSVDAAARTITLDAPTRYVLRTRDRARVFRPTGYLSEVGLEDLALGMREHPTSAPGTLPGPLGDRADELFDDPGTAAYTLHGSVAVRLDAVRDGWLHRVETYAPAGNASGAHVLSSAVFLTAGTHRVTVERCRLERPQYRGGGGNGYLFWVEGSDNLFADDVAVGGRHNLITAHIASSGNVFLRARTVDSRFSDDSHRLLAQANLYDSVVLERAWLQAVNRGATSSGAGFTATQTVFWNTRVVAVHPSTRRAGDGFPEGFAVETAQYAWGYAIGTAGPGAGVSTRSITNGYWSTLDPGPPVDFVEGVGRGATLFPASLYDEQRRRRLARGE